MNNLFMQFMQFMRNPREYMKQAGIPDDKMGNPNDAAQWLLNNGKINQNQYNQAAQQAGDLSAQFQKMMK